MLLILLGFLAGLFYGNWRAFPASVGIYWGLTLLTDIWDYFTPFDTVTGKRFTIDDIFP